MPDWSTAPAEDIAAIQAFGGGGGCAQGGGCHPAAAAHLCVRLTAPSCDPGCAAQNTGNYCRGGARRGRPRQRACRCGSMRRPICGEGRRTAGGRGMAPEWTEDRIGKMPLSRLSAESFVSFVWNSMRHRAECGGRDRRASTGRSVARVDAPDLSKSTGTCKWFYSDPV